MDTGNYTYNVILIADTGKFSTLQRSLLGSPPAPGMALSFWNEIWVDGSLRRVLGWAGRIG